MLTELTRVLKEILEGNSVNQVLMVKEGKLVKVSVNQVHSIAKGFCMFLVLTNHLLVNIENYFSTNVHRARSAIKGFC